MTTKELFDLFEVIDPYEPQKINVHIAPGDATQRDGVRVKAAQNLTREYLKEFKRQTEGLSKEELRDYIDNMNLQPPKPSLKHHPHHNSAIFQAQRNFFLFVTALRETLTDPKETTGKPQFWVNSIALACLCMTKADLKPKLTEAKAVEVASKFGYNSKTSGRDLLNSYNDIQSKTQIYKRQNQWNKLFKETALILKPYPKALEALETLKTEFHERRMF